jgi:protein ImuB
VRWIALSYKQTFKQPCKPQETTPQFDANSLFELAAHYSPMVCWRQDQHHEYAGWLVEVHSSFRLFGGAQALLSQLWQSAEEFPGELQLANHHTATGAWWLGKCAPAHTESDFLAMLSFNDNSLLSLPTHALDCDLKLQTTWQQCGFNRIGDLWCLPRDGFLKRFGAQALAELDSGFGVQNKLAPGAVTHTPANTFEQETEMPFHSDRLDLIEHHAQTLLQAVCRWLKQQKHGARELHWSFKHSHGEEILRLRSAQPTDCLDTWKRLLHHQLGRMQFEDDVRNLRVQCAHSELLPNINTSFLPDPGKSLHNWDNTCDVLRARLGEQTVLFAATESDPRPECSVVLQPVPLIKNSNIAFKKGDKTHTPELNNATLPCSAPRPLWLLPQPKPLQGKTPSWQAGGPWQLLSGPERVEFGWWDAQPCKRDYYCARDSNSSLVWLYQDLLENNTRWFLHGYFA